MISYRKKVFTARQLTKNLIASVFLLSLSLSVNAQVIVHTVQNINFGTFYQGSAGGEVELSFNGSRSATGDIVLLNSGSQVSQAIFDIEAPANTTLSIMTGPDVILNGSNGGSITLRIGAADLGTSFTTSSDPQSRTRLQLASKLLVGNSATSPAGNYEGIFSITLYQE